MEAFKKGDRTVRGNDREGISREEHDMNRGTWV